MNWFALDLPCSVEHDPVSGLRPKWIMQFRTPSGRNGYRKNSTGSDVDIQTALITVVKCLIRDYFRMQTGLDQTFGLCYRTRIGMDCTMKILDWIRFAKSPIRSTLLPWSKTRFNLKLVAYNLGLPGNRRSDNTELTWNRKNNGSESTRIKDSSLLPISGIDRRSSLWVEKL